MSTYSWLEWLFFFFFYSFFGWCFESAYVSIKKKHFVNRGFIRGPLLPLYGSGAIMMLVVSIPFKNSQISQNQAVFERNGNHQHHNRAAAVQRQ